MASELEKGTITEIKVRMDCNGCVHKIKKALHGIGGINEIYVDFPHQKLTVIGWADPEKIVKAIRKTRKVATICSHADQRKTEPESSQQPGPEATDRPQQMEPRAGEEADVAASPAESAAPPPEPSKDQPPPEKPADESATPAAASDSNAKEPANQTGQKDVGEVHVIHHYPPDYGHRFDYGGNRYNSYWDRYSSSHVDPHESPSTYTASHGFPHEPPERYAHSPSRLHQPPVTYAHSLRSVPEPPVRYVHSPGSIPEPPVRYAYSPGSVHEPPVRYPHSPRSVHEPPVRYAYSPRSVHEPPVRYAYSQRFMHEPDVRYVQSVNTQEQPRPTHSHNTNRPWPYVTGYEHTGSPPRHAYHGRRDYTFDYEGGYYYGNEIRNGNIAAMFSDENPNSCTAM